MSTEEEACENCGALATHTDADGVPLCDDCWVELTSDTGEYADD